MIYVALLRGINVGKKAKVNMADLKCTFEKCGLTHVSTYINSGNIIFSASEKTKQQLTNKLEKAIESDFGFYVKVLLRERAAFLATATDLPDGWVNDATMKCDVLFLWENYNSPQVIEKLAIKPDIDEVRYVDGALLWRVDRDKLGRSGMSKIVGSEVYKHVTIRNCNTVRKLATLLKDIK